MGVTSRFKLRYPPASNSPNITQDFQNLATDVDNALPGAWVTAYISDSNYLVSFPTANTWVALNNTTQGTVAVPAGRILDVQFDAPACQSSGGFIYVRLMINGTEAATQVFSDCWSPVHLTGSRVGTGAAMTLEVQAQRTAGTGDVRAAGGGVVRLRYRVV